LEEEKRHVVFVFVFFVGFFEGAVLGFELRALSMQGRCSTT
jgi:hypothetical protein